MMAEVLEKQYNAKKVNQRQDELLELARTALKASGADQTQVRILSSDSALTRFAGSKIHQNTLQREANVVVSARVGQREGRAVTNRLDKEAISQAARQATQTAQLSAPNPELADYAEGPQEYSFQVDYFEATAACTPEDRAKKVIQGFEVSDDAAFTASGTLSTSQMNFVLANSNGIEAAYNTTFAKYTVMYTGPNSSGYSEQSSRSINEIDTADCAVHALATARRSANPRNDIPAGRYTVILNAECVATLLNFLAWLGFSGKAYVEGSSCFSGRLGEPVCSPDVTIVDDPLDPRTLGVPCDAAGVPKQRLSLVESGVVKALAHDANTARKAGTVSTGHDSGVNFPVPANIVLMPGNASREDLIASVERGILVSRFHYTNVVDPMATVLTGMTRDGTFLIENGEVSGGLTNFRFTNSILAALNDVRAMETEQVLVSPFWGSSSLVPASIKVDNFNFSGKTEF
jgi:predicted Zn-dependent protease